MSALPFGVILEQPVEVGGGFQQPLNDILWFHEWAKTSGNEAVILTPHRSTQATLKGFGIEAELLKAGIRDHFILFLKYCRLFDLTRVALRIIAPYEKSLLRHGIDVVYFTNPSKWHLLLYKLPFISIAALELAELAHLVELRRVAMAAAEDATDAQAYVEWLSRTTGKSYRLPSEAEYEYAARAGGTARYASGDDASDLCRSANGADQSAMTAGPPPDASYMPCNDGYAFTAPVGSLAANAFALHDLIGNVWEWTADCYVDDYASAPSDSAVRLPSNCPMRTVRGGDWFSGPWSLRPAVRAKAGADAHHDDIGFRVVRTLAH